MAAPLRRNSLMVPDSPPGAPLPAAAAAAPVPLGIRDESDPARRVAELAQRGRLILDVSAADLEAAEAGYGPFHPTAWHFRNALNEARRSWDRLRAQFGGAALEAALNEPALTFLTLRGAGHAAVLLVPIGGRSYRAERVEGTVLAPVQWRLTRLHPPLEDGPYYACRLRGGSTQCDCAEWTYQIAGNDDRALCKHLAALDALGWI
jgi:hypothetical protein